MNASELNRRQFLTRTTQSSLVISALVALEATVITPTYADPRKASASLSDNATPRQVAESYWRAESERDVEKVGQHYHHDAVFMPPGERLVGWDNIRKWYEATYRRFHSVKVQIVHEISHGNEASLEWKAFLIDAAGAAYTPVGVNIVRVEGGKFREVRAYFDSSILR